MRHVVALIDSPGRARGASVIVGTADVENLDLDDVEETSRQPAPSGQAFISGRRGSSFPLDSDGKFEINNLLPGTYLLEIKIAGHAEIAREVVLGIEDANLELTSKREISK